MEKQIEILLRNENSLGSMQQLKSDIENIRKNRTEKDTARAKKNCDILSKQNLYVDEDLILAPVENFVSNPTKTAVIDLMFENLFCGLCANAVCENLQNKIQEDVKETISKIVTPLWNKFSISTYKNANKFIEMLNNRFSYFDEASFESEHLAFQDVAICLWVLNFLKDTPKPFEEISKKQILDVINSENFVEELKQSKVRNFEEILDLYDLLFRAEFAFFEVGFIKEHKIPIELTCIQPDIDHDIAMEHVITFNKLLQNKIRVTYDGKQYVIKTK